MSASDDDHDDDAQLKQLRSVWVSMRDEEPSDRGMAALMAAARTKAAELEQAAQPSWWQRIAASLRRPPVLALATVTVLLGGALIVTQRKDTMKSNATVETETFDNSKDTRADGEGADPPANGAGAGSAAVAGPASTPTGAPAADPAAVVDKVVREEPSSRKQNRSGPKPTKPTVEANKAAVAKPESPQRDRDDFAPPPPGNTPGTGAATPSLSIAQDADPSPVAAPESAGKAESTRPEPRKPIGRTPAPSIEGEDRQVATLEQLVKQAETAAAKGDCVTVRSIAQRIFSSSPAVYKSRIASKPAIARCLPSTADNASAAE